MGRENIIKSTLFQIAHANYHLARTYLHNEGWVLQSDDRLRVSSKHPFEFSRKQVKLNL